MTPLSSQSPSAPDPRPRSAVTGAVGMVGLLGLFGWFALARARGYDGEMAALVALLACGLPMVLWSLLIDRVHRSPGTGIDWDAPPRPWAEALDTSIVKITGLWAIWAIIGALYCIGRWYWSPPYLFSMRLLGALAVPLLLASLVYVPWLDRRLREPRDGAWVFGQLIIGRAENVDRTVLFDFFRSWAIKAFFLAFMIAITPGNWANAVRAESAWIIDHPANLAIWLIGLMFMVDVTFATVGYTLTMKPLDAHIRSANPYAAGWMAALMCYPPFILMGDGAPLNYYPGTAGADGWLHWLADHPLATAAMGAWLVFLTGVYAWATVAFGIRFSNLTHRGILTHGPYAWTKHPAYLSKCAFWWFSVLPFLAVTGNPVDMIRNTAILALVTLVYFWRAKTEERHLMADPAYREYAAWMARNGPIPRLVARMTPAWLRPHPASVAAE